MPAANSTSKVYETSGGLHGVGVSVANALSERMEVEVGARPKALSNGVRARQAEVANCRTPARRRTAAAPRCASGPTREIFGAKAHFQPERVFKMTRSKAYLFGGVEIRWSCTKELLRGVDNVPEAGDLPFRRRAQGLPLGDAGRARRWCIRIFSPAARARPARMARAQWAVAWSADADGFLNSYCNTIPTPDGGTHESGLRAALLRGLKDHAERVGQGKRAAAITSEDVMVGAARHALGLHPRAGIPGPDQGPPRHRRGADASSSRRSRTRSTIGSPAIRCRRTSCSTSSSSAPKSASAAARKRRSRARPP